MGKADIYLIGSSELHLWAMQNSRHIDFAGSKINIAPPEYVIIMKLEFYKEGNAEKHLSDIKSILNNSSDLIDYNLLKKLINERSLTAEWAAAEQLSENSDQ